MRSTLAITLLLACGGDTTNKPIDASQPIDTALPVDAGTAFHGCRPEAAMDLTAAGADRTISFGDVIGEMYSPRCIRIKTGQTVTWNGNFNEHPMLPGIRVGGIGSEQDRNPIPRTGAAGSRSVLFTNPGAWGFYCNSHPGMEGVVYTVQ